MNHYNAIVIGGGAAGFFAALSVMEHHPNFKVAILEKSSKVLSKVKVSGGGRCNVTHACFDNVALSKFYPRGEKQLRKAFEVFNSKSTIDWFEKRGVILETLPDNCIFPKSNTSQTIIDCFLNESVKKKIDILYSKNIIEFKFCEIEKRFELRSNEEVFTAEKVIVAIGGQPKKSGLIWLENLGHKIIEPVPSLFTFNIPNNSIVCLMGNVVEKTTVKIEGTKLIGKGPLLITHWGLSGPAILKLSAWGARILEEKQYQFSVLINWLDDIKEEELRKLFEKTIQEHGAKMISNLNPFVLTNRIWNFLLEKIEVSPQMRWNELGRKNINKLVNILLNDRYVVSGKTTFKEEFVTAGGVSLESIDFKTMQSKIFPGMYFCGEVLDIDGITGGFNFQAAWTTGWIAGKLEERS